MASSIQTEEDRGFLRSAETWDPGKVLDALASAFAAGVCLTDDQGRIVGASTAWIRLFGHPLDGVPQHVLTTTACPPDQQTAARDSLAACLRGEITPVTVDVCPIKEAAQAQTSPERPPLHLCFGAARVLNRTGIAFAVTTARTPSEAALGQAITTPPPQDGAITRAREVFAAAEAMTGLGSWDWDIPNNTWTVSENTRAMLGLEAHTLPSSALRRLVFPEDWPTVAQALREAFTNDQFHLEARLHKPNDGSARHIEARGLIQREPSGRPLWMRGAIRDITELKATQTLKEDIERITRHDLRSPVAATLSGIEILRLSRESLTDEQWDVLEMMERSLKRSLTIINASHVLYRIESGTYKPDLRALDLREVLADVCEDLAPTVEVRNATLEVAPGPPAVVNGEPWLCGNLFTNLLRNALEALPEQHQTVAVTLRADGEQIIATLTNPGSVPEAIRDTFFQKYATHGKAGGTGLGTYSALLMARAQGGTITLDSSQPGYTSLIVRLPAAV